MARRLIEDGFTTTLWARRAQSLVPFADTGAAYATDRRALGRCIGRAVCLRDRRC